MEKAFSGEAEAIFNAGIERDQKAGRASRALAYHVLFATRRDEEVISFLGGIGLHGLLITIASATEKDYREFAPLNNATEEQTSYICTAAQRSAAALGHDVVKPIDLFYGCCSAIIASRHMERVETYSLLDSYILSARNQLQGLWRGPAPQPLPEKIASGRPNPDHNPRPAATPPQNVPERQSPSQTGAGRTGGVSDEDHTILSKYATLMNKEEFSPFFGRDEEIGRVKKILAHTRKRNAILVGEPGVGKTAIVEGLARDIEQDHVSYRPGRKPQIYALDLTRMISGTMYRGMMEERARELLEAAARNKGKVVLFIDELHKILGAGAAKGTMDLAEIFKPALARSDISVIGATTIDEYREYVEKDKPLSRRFVPVRVDEPSRDECLALLRNSVVDMEEHHFVQYSDGAIQAAYDMGKRYLPKAIMPDAAFDLLDSAGVLCSFATDDCGMVVTANDVAKAVSMRSGLPVVELLTSDDAKILEVENELRQRIFDQDVAIAALGRAARNARAGLRPDRKVQGAFLFVGPTGVGKTETSLVFAETLNVDLIRIDMSEYMEKHSVSRLIGAPPGYVGYNAGGVLTEQVNKKPHSVVLLDEVEKAHPDIFNILLQVLDNGGLKDGQGRDIDFRHTTIIMTTNVGQTAKRENVMGFTGGPDTETVPKELKKLFPPELRNRVDAIVEFGALSKAAIERVAGQVLLKTARGLMDKKGISIEFTAAVQAQVAERGTEVGMNARPLARFVADHIGDVLSVPILKGELKKGDRVVVDFKTAADGKPGGEFVLHRKVANDYSGYPLLPAPLAAVK